jgi:hypothetical protein
MSTGGLADDFDQVVEQYHRALGEFMRGDCSPQASRQGLPKFSA